ncbi:unnamed protein product, partial [Closterium sp. NIES-64]
RQVFHLPVSRPAPACRHPVRLAVTSPASRNGHRAHLERGIDGQGRLRRGRRHHARQLLPLC